MVMLRPRPGDAEVIFGSLASEHAPPSVAGGSVLAGGCSSLVSEMC